MNAIGRTGLWVIAVALGVSIVLFGVYFLHGSLEQLPAEEQQGKVRMVAGLGFVLFSLLEVVLVIALVRVRGRNAKPGP